MSLLEDWDILTVVDIPSALSELPDIRLTWTISGIYKRFSAMCWHLNFKVITTCLRFSGYSRTLQAMHSVVWRVWFTTYVLYALKPKLFGKGSTPSLWLIAEKQISDLCSIYTWYLTCLRVKTSLWFLGLNFESWL